MSDFSKSFKKGIKIGFNSFLGSQFIIFSFFIFGVLHILGMFKNGLNFLDILGLILCMYNTYWLTSVVDLRKKIHQIVFEYLKDSKLKKSDKKFLSDVIFTLNWKNIISLDFADKTEEEKNYLEKIVYSNIQEYSEDKLLERV
jgi:hypothetical protein